MCKYINFNELIQGLNKLEKDEANDIWCMDVMIVLLLRSGVTVDEIVKLKNSDFDFDKKLVTIKNGKTIRKLKLSDEVLKWVDKSKKWDGAVPKTRFVMNTLDDYIIRLSGDVYDEQQAKRSIKRRLGKFREVGFTPISENVLIGSKRIDALDEIVARQGYVSTDDFKKIQAMYGNSDKGYFKLKTNYEILRGGEYIKMKQRGRKPKQAN